MQASAVIRHVVMMSAIFTLTACSSSLFNSNETPKTSHVAGVNVNGQETGASELGSPAKSDLPSAGPLAGNIEGSMNSVDKSKLTHALDNGIGKPTHWVNPTTGIAYTVVPTKKMTIGDNPYCRQYTVTAEKDGASKDKTGTACVASDSSWRTVGG